MRRICFTTTVVDRFVSLVLTALFFVFVSTSTHASDRELNRLSDTDLDNLTAGAASANVHATAFASGLYTLAGTGAHSRAYLENCNYFNVSHAAGHGWAIASGSLSEVSVQISVNASGVVTRSHQVTHTASSPNSGTAYASGYKMELTYNRRN